MNATERKSTKMLLRNIAMEALAANRPEYHYRQWSKVAVSTVDDSTIKIRITTRDGLREPMEFQLRVVKG